MLFKLSYRLHFKLLGKPREAVRGLLKNTHQYISESSARTLNIDTGSSQPYQRDSFSTLEGNSFLSESFKLISIDFSQNQIAESSIAFQCVFALTFFAGSEFSSHVVVIQLLIS